MQLLSLVSFADTKRTIHHLNQPDPPDEFETYLGQALPSRWLCPPPQEALSNLSAVALGQEDVNLFKHGNPVMLEESMTLQSKVMSVRVCDRDGIFLGVGQLCAGGLTKYRLQPKVVFN